MKVLFAWLVLDSHDKGATSRVLGGSPAHPTAWNGLWGILHGVLRSLAHWLNLALNWLIELDSRSSGWTGRILEGLPRQQDNSSCGVFMTAFAESVLCGWAPPYRMSQADIPLARSAIAALLLNLDSSPSLVHNSRTFSLD